MKELKLKTHEIENVNFKKITFKILLITSSILILIVPDIIVNINKDFLNFSLILILKINLFLFMGLILLKLTKSYFKSYLILGIPYLISSTIETVNVLILNGYTRLDHVKALFNTSMNEIMEFTQGFYLYLFLPLLVIILYLFFLKKYKTLSIVTRNNKLILPSALVALLICVSISTFMLYNSYRINLRKNLVINTIGHDYIEQHPFNLYYRISKFTILRYQLNKFKKEKENFKFEVQNTNDKTQANLVILIIGERIRYSNWSINGYHRKTSPNLEKIINLISFSKNYSNSNTTSNSIPLIITQATPQTFNNAYTQKTIVSLFKEAGYETVWISNQNVFNYIDNKNEPDTVIELYNKRHSDIDIIPIFDSVVNTNNTKNKLIIINMSGGHGYVPPRFNEFKPTMENYPMTIDNKPRLINTYDNMILLQDFFLSEIINLTERQNLSSILLFTSDHACSLFEDGNLFGYGSHYPTEKEIHVPLFIWGSEKYILNNNYKYNNLIKHKDVLTTNDNIFYTLVDLASIEYKTFDKIQSIADSSYIEPSKIFLYVNNKTVEFKD